MASRLWLSSRHERRRSDLRGRGRYRPVLLLKYGNRHGLIAGATGTGKTVTLQTLAQGFSRIGVPVFMADVKGDLSGLAQAGAMCPKLKERLDALKLKDFAFTGCPVVLSDVFGERGHPAP